ncbi:Nif11-like leader peptide family RiPP precursor [Pleurocapsa sp. PCC 7319]|uniref:Nif11-like leader peptide family RiPP precursor n=1 Tax=Pleurocapsa sp. PCC 7319 TaxID=118161 RepID=UPI0003495AA1|nr:Nif11-like leader peptide family RiPP precursor [Pleurocapsa sp. PCC 7319]
MTTKNAARIYKKLEQAQLEEERQQALSDPEAFIVLAKAKGYTFTVKDLETQICQLSDEELASILNPGIGPRRHLFPK